VTAALVADWVDVMFDFLLQELADKLASSVAEAGKVLARSCFSSSTHLLLITDSSSPNNSCNLSNNPSNPKTLLQRTLNPNYPNYSNNLDNLRIITLTTLTTLGLQL
jgi:hypothetical protein